MDVWAWESPAWAETTSIVNCPITRLSLFRSGRGGGEQRMGQGGGNHNSRAGQDGRATELPHCVLCGFHRGPGCGLRHCGLCCGIQVGCEGDGGRFFSELSRLGFSCDLASSSRAGAEQCDAIRMRTDGRVSRSSRHRPYRAWLGIPTDMSAYSAAVSHRGKLKEGGAWGAMRCNEVHEAAWRRPRWHTLGVMIVSGARIQKNSRPSAVGFGQLEPIDAPVPLAGDGDAMPRCDLSTGLDHRPGPPVKHSAPGSWSLGRPGDPLPG